MSFGIETGDEQGRIITKISDRHCKIIGTSYTGTEDGAFAIQLPYGGTPVFFLVPTITPDWQSVPATELVGSTVVWRFYGKPNRSNCAFIYGWY